MVRVEGLFRSLPLALAVALPAQGPVPRRYHHVVLEPLDLIARLAALVLKPRGNLTRYHGLLYPLCWSMVLWINISCN